MESALHLRVGSAKQARRLGLLDLSADGVQALSEELQGRGIDNVSVACDVTREKECQDAIARVIQRFGGIDLLINNAGITHRSAFRDTNLEVFQRVMGVNFFGSLYCTKAALDSLIERKGLIIVDHFGRGVFTSLRSIRLCGQ